MKKLLCCDIDGTLLDSNHRLKESTITSINRFIKEDNVFTLVSGRFRFGVKNILKHFDYPIGFSCFNGNYTEVNNKVLYSKTIDNSILKQVVSFIKDYDVFSIIFSLDSWYCEKKNDLYYKSEKLYEKEAKIVNFDNMLNTDKTFYKILIKGDEKLISFLESKLISIFKDKVSVVKSNKYQIEVMPLNTNKATALKCFSSYFNITNTYSIGDYDNDLEMIKESKISFAMKNSSDSILNNASFVTLSNDEDGVTNALSIIMGW